jgi:Domain of unknown function (DUF4265)
VGHPMEERIELTAHDHVKVAVEGALSKGVESVPAQYVGDGKWLLLRSPLYAMQLAAGDIIATLDNEAGAFEVISRGGNVAVHFYLPESDLDDSEATKAAADDLEPRVAKLQGLLDGKTLGLMVFTIPVSATFRVIEDLFAAAVSERPGAQWQFANVYHPTTGEPLRWWE